MLHPGQRRFQGNDNGASVLSIDIEHKLQLFGIRGMKLRRTSIYLERQSPVLVFHLNSGIIDPKVNGLMQVKESLGLKVFRSGWSFVSQGQGL